MIYCPKCHNVTKDLICPFCNTDVMCYDEQQNKMDKEDIDTLRSNHRIMPELKENQEDMIDILRKELY